MHILVISQYFWPENFRINDLVSDFVERGHLVTVLTGVPNYPEGRVFDDYRKNPSAFLSYLGARVIRVPMTTRGSGAISLLLNYFTYALSASLLGSWRLRRESIDVIFVYEPSPVTVGIPGALMRRLLGAPLVFWVLDLWPETLKAVGVIQSRSGLGLVALLVRWIYRRCDLILAQSKSFIPQIRAYSDLSKRVEYFPSWAESLFGAGFEASAAPEVPSQSGAFTVMFAGNIGEAQDFPSILNAAELLSVSHPHIRWIIVGDGRLGDWVSQEVKRRNLESNVFLLGRFPVERMPSFFRSADALLVTLKSEPIFAMTIPGKLQSYLASGKPIVAMLDGEGARLLQESGAGIAAPSGDAAKLAAAVVSVSEMPEPERALMGRNGAELYAQEFERNTLLDRLELWMKQLAVNYQADRE
ncbi:glycosyltransferase family 4 protein [Rhodoferax mekongensis]|uniref:glycosyltransferase family 4 protein n=1 Tax=Rhodoferax mekongensis TaxID=3068341 RepID=UPI0028BEAD7C|nr:glycosyltransferase family 4 protein [Rhodoferax sp. TBRC 17199]MDT7516793.1 glycosyltransferase family 4 protein [Rhodoferax sp. TBRC 17199]